MLKVNNACDSLVIFNTPTPHLSTKTTQQSAPYTVSESAARGCVFRFSVLFSACVLYLSEGAG